MTRLSAAKARGSIPGPKAKASKPEKAPALKESEIQKQIKEYLQWKGWFVFKIHQSLGSYKGIADLYAIKNGRGVWIEVKTQEGSQSEDQIQFQFDIEAHGGEYLVARSIEDLAALK